MNALLKFDFVLKSHLSHHISLYLIIIIIIKISTGSISISVNSEPLQSCLDAGQFRGAEMRSDRKNENTSAKDFASSCKK